LSHRVCNWRAERTLEEEMQAQGIVGIQGVDTRTLVRHLRNEGSIAAGIFSGDAASRPVEELIEEVKAQDSMAGADLSAEVSTDEVYTIPVEGEKKYTVVAYDMGIKLSTPRHFAQRGIETIVVPSNTSFADIQQYDPDGVFVSNGPADPATADDAVAFIREVLAAEIPFLGICFGNQLLGRALELETFKMKSSHRGFNTPVMNHLSGKIDITTQHHTFALAMPTDNPEVEVNTHFGPAHVTLTCLNDYTVEGVALTSGLAYSVQYHPESAAGPHDANPLFDQFIDLMANNA